MENKEFLTIPELAKLLGISRIAVYNKVKSGEIEATKIGRNYAISQKTVVRILRTQLDEKSKKECSAAVKKTVDEYGDLLRMLGRE